MPKFWLENYELKSNESLEVFNSNQICEIELGIKNRLSNEQISVYAKPEFDYMQMGQICMGFEDGLTMEQVSIFAKPELDWLQMEQAREGFELGLTIEQISIYLRSELDYIQMGDIRKNIVDKIKHTVLLDLQETDDRYINDIKLYPDGIYFCDENLITMKALLEMHPELLSEFLEQELEPNDNEDRME